MSIRTDAAKCVKKQKHNNEVKCTMNLALTDAHWEEARAKAKHRQSKESQRDYIRSEAGWGFEKSCGCDGGVSPEMPNDSLVTAACAQDPSSVQDKTKKNDIM